MDVHNDLGIFALSLTCTSGVCILIVHCTAGGEGAEVEPEETQPAEDKQGLLLLLLLNYKAGSRGRGGVPSPSLPLSQSEVLSPPTPPLPLHLQGGPLSHSAKATQVGPLCNPEGGEVGMSVCMRGM